MWGTGYGEGNSEQAPETRIHIHGAPHHGFLPLLKLEPNFSFWGRTFLPGKILLAHTCPYPAVFATSQSSRHHGDLCLRADLLPDQSYVHLGCQVMFWKLKVTVKWVSRLNSVKACVAVTGIV